MLKFQAFASVIVSNQARKPSFETKRAKACCNPHRVLVLPRRKLTSVKPRLSVAVDEVSPRWNRRLNLRFDSGNSSHKALERQLLNQIFGNHEFPIRQYDFPRACEIANHLPVHNSLYLAQWMNGKHLLFWKGEISFFLLVGCYIIKK